MRALARWSFTHRRTVVAAWIAVLVALTALHSAAGSAYKDSFRLHGTDSFDAVNLLQDSAPKAAGDTDRIVFATQHGSLTDPANAQRVRQMLARVKTLPHVASVGRPTISKNGQIGFVSFLFDTQANKLALRDIKRVVDTAQSFKTPTLQVELIDVVAAGDDMVVVILRPPSGPPVANLATFSHGKVVEMVHYPNPDDALNAAGGTRTPTGEPTGS